MDPITSTTVARPTAQPAPAEPADDATANDTKRDSDGGSALPMLGVLVGIPVVGWTAISMMDRVKAVPPQLVDGQLVRQPLQVQAGRNPTVTKYGIGIAGSLIGAAVAAGGVAMLAKSDGDPFAAIAGLSGILLGGGAIAGSLMMASKIR